MQQLSFLTYLFFLSINILKFQCQCLLVCLIFSFNLSGLTFLCNRNTLHSVDPVFMRELCVCVWSEIGNIRMPACSRTLFSLRRVNFPVSSVIPGQSEVTEISIWKSPIHLNCAHQITLPFYDLFCCHAKVQPILTLPSCYMLNFALYVVFHAWLIYSGYITY